MITGHSNSQRGLIRRWLSPIISLLILGAGSAIGYWLLTTPPEASRHQNQPKHQATLVAVQSARATSQYFMIHAHGTVEAANKTTLSPQVSGRLVKLDQNLAPGTHFKANQTLGQIDPKDSKLALQRAKSNLATAKAKLATEKGQQAVAKRELKQVGSKNVTSKERRLALRKPQFNQAMASVRSARSSVKQAKLNLKRTHIRAPFDGIVISRNASIGDVVSTGSPIATLASTDQYWITVSLPVKQIRWLHASSGQNKGSAARVYYPQDWGPKQYLKASILRIQGQLEKKGRMAQVLLQVPNPLGAASNGGQPLLIGAFVPVQIKARPPSDAVTIPAADLRENDHVWIDTPQDKLAIRKVHVAYKGNSRAIVTSGLKPGDKVVKTDLSAPIAGEPLRVSHNNASQHKTAAATKRNNRNNKTHSSDPSNDSAAQSRSKPPPNSLRLAPAAGLITPATARHKNPAARDAS